MDALKKAKQGGRNTTYSLGKVDRNYLRRVIYPRLGLHRREVVVGPRFGVDNAVLRVGSGNVLVATTDPLSCIPGLKVEESAWLSVHLLASDLTTCGFAPQFGIFDFNLPSEIGNREFARYWNAFHLECKKLGLAIVGGHTGRYPGGGFSIIGAGVMYSICGEREYVTSSMARDGDDLILTKGVAVETTAVLSRVFPRTLRKALGTRLFEKARRYLPRVSTVKDALAAASVGLRGNGVTAMHDATEGGVCAAIIELGTASGLGAEVDLTNVDITEETRQLCEFFHIDPLTSLSEGSLIIAARPQATKMVLRKLDLASVESQVIGHLTSKRHAIYANTRRGRTRLAYPRHDPYWMAYWKGIKKRWN